MRGLGFALMTLMLALFAAPAIAQPVRPGPHVHIQLLPESDSPAANGEVALAFASSPDAGWHAYWQNPGDAGLPTNVTWTLPSGVTAGEIAWPVPGRLSISGLMNYVYKDPFVPLGTLTIGNVPAGTRLPIKVHLQYLVCTDTMCVPESADLATELTVGGAGGTPERRAQFDGWRAALPKPLGSAATYQLSGDVLRIAVPYPAGAALGDAYFYPSTLDMVDYAAPQKVTRDGDRLVIETKAKGPVRTGALEGVLSTAAGQGFTIKAVAGTVAAASTGSADQGVWMTVLIAFGGAVLGGMLLNIMPCVFPILSLKALSLAKANDGEGTPRADALAYAAGVILVCLALGATLLAIRAAGSNAGWAFQLQDPRVIFVLLLLLTAIALNLAGLFELSAPRFVNRLGTSGAGGSFMTGALAAFIATPCTGPFMGAALAATLVLPWAGALAIFGGLGLGIALPFLAVGFIPALRRRLPRPGAWMVTFRHILSVPMFLTAIALAWVLGREAGVNGMALGLVAALLAGLGLWWAGARQIAGKRAWLAPLLLIVPAVAMVALIHPAPAGAAKPIGNADPFSEGRLAELTAQGKPVFAYFTADWCVTCKVNEKAVIETDAVTKALADGKVTVLVGDWTDGNPALGRFIEAHNRAGVPLYLWYKPGQSEPEVLPQILTQSMLEARAAAK